MAKNNISVEVVYGTAKEQWLKKISVEEGSTIESVITISGVLQAFPEIDLSKQLVGVFSERRQLEDKVKANDRIEIYRPLFIDPKEARRAKAKAKSKARKN